MEEALGGGPPPARQVQGAAHADDELRKKLRAQLKAGTYSSPSIIRTRFCRCHGGGVAA